MNPISKFIFASTFFCSGILFAIVGHMMFIHVTKPIEFSNSDKNESPGLEQMQAYVACSKAKESVIAPIYLACKKRALDQWFFVPSALANCELEQAKMINDYCKNLLGVNKTRD